MGEEQSGNQKYGKDPLNIIGEPSVKETVDLSSCVFFFLLLTVICQWNACRL